MVLTLSAESFLGWVGQEPGKCPAEVTGTEPSPMPPIGPDWPGRTLFGTSTGVPSRKLLFVHDTFGHYVAEVTLLVYLGWQSAQNLLQILWRSMGGLGIQGQSQNGAPLGIPGPISALFQSQKDIVRLILFFFQPIEVARQADTHLAPRLNLLESDWLGRRVVWHVGGVTGPATSN